MWWESQAPVYGLSPPDSSQGMCQWGSSLLKEGTRESWDFCMPLPLQSPFPPHLTLPSLTCTCQICNALKWPLRVLVSNSFLYSSPPDCRTDNLLLRCPCQSDVRTHISLAPGSHWTTWTIHPAHKVFKEPVLKSLCAPTVNPLQG